MLKSPVSFIPFGMKPINTVKNNKQANVFFNANLPVTDVFVKSSDNLKKSVSFGSLNTELKVQSEPVPYADSGKFAVYFQKKIEDQLGDYTPEDITGMINNVAKETGVSKEEAAEVISRMNAFSGWSQLDAMEKSINKLNVNGIYYSFYDVKESALGLEENTAANRRKRYGQLNINDVMAYLSLKKHLMKYSETSKNRILFIDDFEINRLKEMKEKNSLEYMKVQQQLENGRLKLAFFDGWNAKSEGKNVGQGLFGSPVSPEESAIAVIKRMQKEDISLDEALNGETIKELRSIFGDDVSVNIIQNEEIPGNSAEEIAKKMSTNHPEAADIYAAETVIVEKYLPCEFSDKERDEAYAVLNKYLDAMLLCHSAKHINEYMKNLHSKILEVTKADGKTEDDIVYIIPSQGKSFELMSYQYAKANDIDSSKFIYYNAFDMKYYDVSEKSVHPDLDGKTLVLIDDMVGTGVSMLEQEFRYPSFNRTAISSQKPTNIIFCPLTGSQNAVERIKTAANINARKGRTMPDLVIARKTSDYFKFKKTLSKLELNKLEKILGYKGLDNTCLCCAMPYMLPDNNTSASSIILSPFLKNGFANKNSPYAAELECKIKQKKEEYLSKQKSKNV